MLILVSAPLARPVYSQTTSVRLTGSVMDSRTGEPIASVMVSVNGTIAAVTDAEGRFEIADLSTGLTINLEFGHTAYQPLSTELEIGSRTRIRIIVNLDEGALELAPIEIEATYRPSHLAGFYRRREVGLGHHVTREEFEEWNPSETTDLLRRIPIIRMRPNPYWTFGGDTRRYVIETRRGVGSDFVGSGGPECPVVFFVDGGHIGNAKDNIIDMFPVDAIDAVETYAGPSQTPPEFNVPGSSCGVVAIWTRLGQRQDRSTPGPPAIWGLGGAALGVALGVLSPNSCRHCLFSVDRRQRVIANAVVLGGLSVLASRLFASRTSVPRRAPVTPSAELLESPFQRNILLKLGVSLRF